MVVLNSSSLEDSELSLLFIFSVGFSILQVYIDIVLLVYMYRG